MKKLFLFLILALGLSACEGKDGLDGRDGKDAEMGWHVEWLEVGTNKAPWVLSDNEKYYYVDFEIPELTQHVFDDGNLSGYILLSDREAEPGAIDAKASLPYTEFHMEDDGYRWQKKYDINFEVGYVRIFLEYSDFAVEDKPGTTKFNVVLMW